MAYIQDKSNAYNFFGETPKSISTSPVPPEKILKRAQANPAKAVEAFMSPIKVITKTAIEKATNVPSSEEQFRALVEKILLEHDLIAPNPHWEHPFKSALG